MERVDGWGKVDFVGRFSKKVESSSFDSDVMPWMVRSAAGPVLTLFFERTSFAPMSIVR